MGDAVKQVVERARAATKPVVIERLDFREKKARLEGTDPARARLLSALAYCCVNDQLSHPTTVILANARIYARQRR